MKSYFEFIKENKEVVIGSADDKEDLKYAEIELKKSKGGKMLDSKDNLVIGKDGGFLAQRVKSKTENNIVAHVVYKKGSQFLFKTVFYDIERHPDDNRWSFSVFSQDVTYLGSSRNLNTSEKLFNAANEHIEGSIKGKPKIFKSFSDKKLSKL